MARMTDDQARLQAQELALSNSPSGPVYDPFGPAQSTVQFGTNQRANIPYRDGSQSEFQGGVENIADNGSQSVANTNEQPTPQPAGRMTASERLASMYQAARETGDRRRASGEVATMAPLPSGRPDDSTRDPRAAKAAPQAHLDNARAAMNTFDQARDAKKQELESGTENKSPEESKVSNDKQKEALERSKGHQAKKAAEAPSDQPSWNRKKNTGNGLAPKEKKEVVVEYKGFSSF